ncbi:MAG: hypothetical protein GWP66_08595 [Gammaproteobacteria bacterium]|jgi:hypothetical protein|nr:hypothetical protein [Gammaproteobacteria bacterium]
MPRYYVTGVDEGEHEIVIQIVYVGDDFEDAVAAANAGRGDYDRVILKDREGDLVEF